MDLEQVLTQEFMPSPPINIEDILTGFITSANANTSETAEESKVYVAPSATITIEQSGVCSGTTNSDTTGVLDAQDVKEQINAAADFLAVATSSEAAADPAIPNTPPFAKIGIEGIEGIDIDAFLEESRIKDLEKQLYSLQQELGALQQMVEHYKDKCDYLKNENDRVSEERACVKKRVSSLKQRNDELEEKLLTSNKSLRECNQKLTTARDSLEKERRATDAAKASMEKAQHDVDAAHDTLKGSQRQVSQQAQEIERLRLKSDKLEEMLTTEHDRGKEYKLELEKLRSEAQHYASAKAPIPQHHFMPMPAFAAATYSSKPRGFESGYNPAGEYDYDPHYAKEHLHRTKRPAHHADLRDVLDSKELSQFCKRLCFNGNTCTRQQCNYAHSIAELRICPNEQECNRKARCGYMLHSEGDRHELYMYSNGKLERLCESYYHKKTCAYGEKCYKLHCD